MLEPIRHSGNPRFGGVIFRRESPQITNEGGLWDSSGELYPLTGGRPFVGNLEWKWPSGARISMRHLQLESDKYKWDGTQLPFIGIDELPHFSESQFWYLQSRARSLCGVKPYTRASCNPDPGWVKKLLAQWVDKTHPDPARSGELRWFVRHKGELVWSRDRDSLAKRFADVGKIPRSLTFVRSSVYDNPQLLEKNPEYIANLQSLPPLEEARLLHGDWDIKREGLCYAGLADLVADFDPATLVGKRVGGIDWGWTHPFCALAAVLDHDGDLWVWFERYQSYATLPQHSAVLPRDGTVWQADPSRPDSIHELAGGGHVVRSCVHLGSEPIISGIELVAERIRTKRIHIHRSCQNLLRESQLYVFDENGYPVDENNHACDALRYLVVGTDRGRLVTRPPAEILTPEQLEQLERAKQAEREQKRREWWTPNNPVFFPGSDDDE